MERLGAREIAWVVQGLEGPLDDPYTRWDLEEDAVATIAVMLDWIRRAHAIEIIDVAADDAASAHLQSAVAESLAWAGEAMDDDDPAQAEAFDLSDRVRDAAGIRIIAAA